MITHRYKVLFYKIHKVMIQVDNKIKILKMIVIQTL
jgi:hypothetical protein